MELSNDPLVVAVVLTAAPQSLRREVKKFRTRLRKKKGQIPELKASQSVLAWNRKRLERLAKLDIEVVVVAAEKIARARFHEPEELYRLLCARAVEECLRRSPSLTLCIDKRYTNPTLRTIQDHTMQIPVQQFGQILVIEHGDSTREPALQQADLVAWAFLQKCAQGDDSVAALIQDRVVVETVLRRW